MIMFGSLSAQRRRLVVITIGLASALIVALMAVSIIRGITGRVSAVPQDVPGPVLLVPGYGGRVASLDPLAATLREAGRTVVVVDRLGDGTGDLSAEAEHLDEVAQQTLAESGAPSVDVIGYSAGGVVARLWVRDHDGAVRARRVLTVGSPHHGSSQAALGREFAGGCPTACEQLIPDSDLLRRLNAGDETPDGPDWITVRSRFDEVVTPVDSAALDGALNVLIQDVCPGSTAEHGALPGDPVTLATVASVLAADSPRTPTGVAC